MKHFDGYIGRFSGICYEIKIWQEPLCGSCYCAYIHLPYSWVGAKMNSPYSDDDIPLLNKECTFREVRSYNRERFAVVGWDYQHATDPRPLTVDEILADIQVEINHMVSQFEPDWLQLGYHDQAYISGSTELETAPADPDNSAIL